MKLKSCIAENFGSYESFEFNFENQGLTLIYGSTGSGKSTLQDVVCWALFGTTAKDGSVDDVRSWTNPGKFTKVSLSFSIEDQVFVVTRIRGKQSENDLYWLEYDNYDQKNRGKDVTETQRLFEKRIGITSKLYISGAYFSEFSPTRNFFTAKASDKRKILEDIANTEFAIKAAESFKIKRKTVEKELQVLDTKLQMINHTSERLVGLSKEFKEYAEEWEFRRQNTIKILQAKFNNFETEKKNKISILETQIEMFELTKNRNIDNIANQIEKLHNLLKDKDDKCSTCKTPRYMTERNKLENYLNKLEEVIVDKNPGIVLLEAAKNLENTYKEQLEQLQVSINPHKKQIISNMKSFKDNEVLYTKESNYRSVLDRKVQGLKQIYELSFDLRGEILKRAIHNIQKTTNDYIEKHFDAALRIYLSIEGSDSLKVGITKDSYECSYKQLSKGQRCMLSLCFSVSFMKVAANNNSVHFDTLFFDEALDGLDTELKVKAFSLFKELNIDHNSIFLIDHSEDFKALFDNKYHVTMESDTSKIERIL